jgi:hypothetical protein
MHVRMCVIFMHVCMASDSAASSSFLILIACACAYECAHVQDDSPKESPRARSPRSGVEPSQASTPETISTLGGLSRMQTPIVPTHHNNMSDPLMPDVPSLKTAPRDRQLVAALESGLDARYDNLPGNGVVVEVRELQGGQSGHAAWGGIAAGREAAGLESSARAHEAGHHYQQELASPAHTHSEETGPAVRPATAEAGGEMGGRDGRERRAFTATLSPLRETHGMGARGHFPIMRPSTAPEVTGRVMGESALSASFANRAENWKEMMSSEHGMPFWYNKFTGESRWQPPAKRAYEEEEDASHFKQRPRHVSKGGMKRKSKEEEKVPGVFERVPSDAGDASDAERRTSFRGATSKVKLANSFMRVSSKGSAGFGRVPSGEKDVLTLDDDSGSEKGGDTSKAVRFDVTEVQEETQVVKKPKARQEVCARTWTQ